MRSIPTPPLVQRLFALLVAAMLLASACSSGTMADTVSSASDAAAPASRTFGEDMDASALDESAMDDSAMDSSGGADSFEEVEAEEAALTTGSTGIEAQTQLVDLGRDIIYTAHLDLASTDVSAATRDAVRTVEGLGGFLFSQQTDGQTGVSQLVFKVLPEQFPTVLERLGSLGTVRSQAVSAEDVTSIVVDLQSRISTAEASVLRLRALIEEANDFQIIADLENQLLDRETTLERLRGQLRSVQNQVDLATINVSIVELINRPDLATAMTVVAGHDGGQSCSQGMGATSITIDGPATMCLRLVNRGDVALVDLALAAPVLGLDLGGFVLLDGSIDQLDPGMAALLVAEVDVEEAVRSVRVEAVAMALDFEGDRTETQVSSMSQPLWIEVPESEELPGFGDVLRGSWNAVRTIAILLAIALVAVAPFAAVALVLSPLAVWIWRRMPKPTLKPAASASHASAPRPPMPPAPTPPPPGPRDANPEDAETTVSA